VIFRRKSAQPPPEPSADDAALQEELERARPHGPWDRSETDADADDPLYIDLGGLVVHGGPDLELQLQVDEESGVVVAVLLAGKESGLELRAFAAPRSSGIWTDVADDIAAEAARRGGTATVADGEFGSELRVSVPVQTPDGQPARQLSRIVGVDGPRWLLRGTFLGKSAVDPDPDGAVEKAFRDVIVVRGDGPMAPRDVIAMRLPVDAEQLVGSEQEPPAEGDEE
jgi:hypothetical protein